MHCTTTFLTHALVIFTLPGSKMHLWGAFISLFVVEMSLICIRSLCLFLFSFHLSHKSLLSLLQSLLVLLWSSSRHCLFLQVLDFGALFWWSFFLYLVVPWRIGMGKRHDLFLSIYYDVLQWFVMMCFTNDGRC